METFKKKFEVQECCSCDYIYLIKEGEAVDQTKCLISFGNDEDMFCKDCFSKVSKVLLKYSKIIDKFIYLFYTVEGPIKSRPRLIKSFLDLEKAKKEVELYNKENLNYSYSFIEKIELII